MIDITYGRISLHIPKRKLRKVKNGIPTISWFLPDWKPAYIYQCKTYLSYTVNGNFYKIYNPDEFRFNLDSLIFRIREWHIRWDNCDAVDFQILEQTP